MASAAASSPRRPHQPDRGVKVLEATDFYYPWIAGPAPLIRGLSNGLAERGHEVVIACPSPEGHAYDEPSGSPGVHRVRTWPVPFGYHLRAGVPFVDLSRLVARMRPDVIHIHHPFPISLAAVAAGRLHQVPIVATNHTIPECTLFGLRGSGTYRPAMKALGLHIRLTLSAAQAVTTPTETAARLLRELDFRKPIQAISNGVDTTRFRPDPLRDTAASVPTVLYTGRLDDDKDMDTFIRAIPHVLKRVQARFRIGGEGTDRARLERLVASMGLSSHVKLTGYVKDDDLPAVYGSADVYAISSRVELQSISTLEAMASGLPIVAVDAGALPEIVRTGVNGFLVPPGNSEAFGNAIASLLTDEDDRLKKGAKSRSIAEQHSHVEMVSQYERLFQTVAVEHATGAVYGAAGL